jgi:hypothetical protein
MNFVLYDGSTPIASNQACCSSTKAAKVTLTRNKSYYLKVKKKQGKFL